MPFLTTLKSKLQETFQRPAQQRKTPHPPAMTYEADTQAKSPLFRLPRELRDRIWDYALCGTQVHVLKEDHVITLAYPSPNLHIDPEPDVNFPRWLLASKQALAEGLEQFARSGACTRIAPHKKPWTCAFGPLAIRDALLMPQIRNLSLHLQMQLWSNEYNERVGGSIVTMSICAGPQGDRYPHVPFLCKSGFSVLEFLPNAENLHLRLRMTGLQQAARPKHVSLSVTSLRCLGTAWKRVRVSVLRPELQVHWGVKDDVPPYIAPLAATYPRVQKALVMLSGHLMRHLGRLPPAGPEEKWPSAEYRESGFWHVSEVNMHPCEEYEPSEYDKVERGFKIRDSMDEETGEWCFEVEEKLGKVEVQNAGKLLHTGLRDWVHVPTPPGDGVLTKWYYKRDAVAKFGEHVSWTCEETGRVVWIEDKEKAVTGFMDIEGDGRQHESFAQEPAQPQLRPPLPYELTECVMPSNSRYAGVRVNAERLARLQ